MMLSGKRRLLIITISAALFLPTEWLPAEDLGRLFLTPRERAKLEVMRYAEPEPEKTVVVTMPETEIDLVPEDTELPEIIIEEEPVLSGPVILKGVVKRSDGENTAWVNDSNTYEADPGLDNIDIHNADIMSDGVRMKLPGKVNDITLKVGQTYESPQQSPKIKEQ